MTFQLKRVRSSTLLASRAAFTAIAAIACKEQPRPAQIPPPAVQVMDVTPTNVPFTAEFIGQLDSPQNVEVRARVEAFVDQVLFHAGAGQPPDAAAGGAGELPGKSFVWVVGQDTQAAQRPVKVGDGSGSGWFRPQTRPGHGVVACGDAVLAGRHDVPFAIAETFQHRI